MEEAMTDNENNSGSTDEISAIEYYWRPGCPFCMMLTPKLEATNIPLDEHNIWESPEAAAKVRSVADGNETVPTVVIGSVGLVNPSIEEVEAAVAESMPRTSSPNSAEWSVCRADPGNPKLLMPCDTEPWRNSPRLSSAEIETLADAIDLGTVGKRKATVSLSGWTNLMRERLLDNCATPREQTALRSPSV